MSQRIEGELIKIIKVENGWNVVVWDPELPKPAPGQTTPCSQQPVKWWKTFIFSDYMDVVTFVRTFLEGIEG